MKIKITKEKVEKKEKTDITKIVLSVVGTAGLISIALVAPNALQMFKLFGAGKSKKWQKHYVPTVVSRLVDQGYLEFENTPKGKMLRLTEKGEMRLNQYELGTYTIPKPKRWDKKYRIIVFDIKEYRRPARDKLRIYLQQFGFVRLQNSVWVYPYDCREVVVLLKASFEIGKDILYIEATDIENDRWLKEHFEL